MRSAYESVASRLPQRACWKRLAKAAKKRPCRHSETRILMKAFEYASASSPASARELAGADGRYLAGGMDLLSEMKEYIAQPKILVNIKSLPGLDKIERGEKVWSFGANVTISEIEDDEQIRKIFPALQQAAAEVGSRQIRNLGTLGGNLAQHSRCWYYRHRDIPCLKKGGDLCYARHGDNRYHSLFTG